MKNLIYICFAGLIFFSAYDDNNNTAKQLNEKAEMPSTFKFDTLGLKVMATSINKKAGTMSTLYANPLALKNTISGAKNQEAGEVLTLITWKQQEDIHWFGARIPGDLLSAELIKTTGKADNVITAYKKYEGKELTAIQDTTHQQDRINYIFAQQPSVMP